MRSTNEERIKIAKIYRDDKYHKLSIVPVDDIANEKPDDTISRLSNSEVRIVKVITMNTYSGLLCGIPSANINERRINSNEDRIKTELNVPGSITLPYVLTDGVLPPVTKYFLLESFYTEEESDDCFTDLGVVAYVDSMNALPDFSKIEWKKFAQGSIY